MKSNLTPFAQLEAIFKTYPAWLRPTHFMMALSALIVSYLLPAGGLPSTLGILLSPVGFLLVAAAYSFTCLCIAEVVVRKVTAFLDKALWLKTAMRNCLHLMKALMLDFSDCRPTAAQI